MFIGEEMVHADENVEQQATKMLLNGSAHSLFHLLLAEGMESKHLDYM